MTYHKKHSVIFLQVRELLEGLLRLLNRRCVSVQRTADANTTTQENGENKWNF